MRDGDTHIDALLELGRDFQVLEQRHGLFGDFEGAQRFGLFHQTVDDGKLAHSDQSFLQIPKFTMKSTK